MLRRRPLRSLRKKRRRLRRNGMLIKRPLKMWLLKRKLLKRKLLMKNRRGASNDGETNEEVCVTIVG